MRLGIPPRSRVAAVLAVGALLAGCAPQGANPEESGRPLTDALIYANKAGDLDEQARQALVTRCMAKAGFTYEPDMADYQPAPAVDIPFVGFTSLTPPDVDTSAESPAAVTMADDALDALMGSATEYQEIVIDGSSVGTFATGGCLGEAQTTLAGGLDNYKAARTLVAQLYQGLGEAGKAAERDPSVTRATEQWATCMRAQGMDYSTPLEVPARAGSRIDQLSTWPDAVADMTCKSESGYMAVAENAMGSAERAYASSHPGLITEWREHVDTRYQRARDVLAGGVP